MKTIKIFIAAMMFFCISGHSQISTDTMRVVAFGTTINPSTQIEASQLLAKELAYTKSDGWQAKGDQHRTYSFPDTGTEMPFRLYVPGTWDGMSELPLVMFLHGAFNTESSYVDANDQQMIKLAERYGFILVSPLGYDKLGAYGTCLKLPAMFGKPDVIAEMIATQVDERWRTLEMSERDVINVLEIVLNEYPVDRGAMFLTGHSMGSGGTWYLGAKYNQYWKAIAPMSGPFLGKEVYPWERIREKPILVSEGAQSFASLESSRQLAEWMKSEGFDVVYKEVEGDHGAMVPNVLPDLFKFFSDLKAE